jgi:hypothetical protein
MDKTKQTETLLVIVLGLVVIYWFKRANGYLMAAILVGGIGLLVPLAGQAIHWGWMKLAFILGEISGRVLLTLVYVLVLLPLAFFARLSGKAAMRRKPAGVKSYFKERDHTYVKEDLTQLW